MMKKLFVQFLFFNFALACITLPYSVHAAQMIVSDKELIQHFSSFNRLLNASQKNTIDKESAPSLQDPNLKKNLSSNESKENIHADSVEKLTDLFIAEPQQATLPLNKVIQPNNREIGLMEIDPYGILKQTAKQILDENNENELLQDSLIAFGQAKQQIDEAEEIINELVGELISSMDPDQLIFSDMVTFQQKSTSNSISIIDESVSNIYLDKIGEKEFSYDRQQALENNDVSGNESINNSFLKKIIHVNTLFYLLATIIILPVIIRIFKFLLFGKYQESFGD